MYVYDIYMIHTILLIISSEELQVFITMSVVESSIIIVSYVVSFDD